MTEPAAASGRVRPGFKTALRLAVAAVALAILATKLPNGEIIPKQHLGFTIALLVAALLCTFLGVVLSAWRWQRVLMVFDVHASLFTLTNHYLAGLFVGSVLPSTVGGDVLRVSRASDTVGSSQVSFASVVLERLTGFVALPVLVFTGFAIKPSMLDNDHAWFAITIALVTLAILGVLLVAAGHPRIAGRFADSEKWTRFIGALHVGIDRLRRNPRQLGPVLGTALLYQFSVCVTFMLVFRALDLPVPLAGALALSPAVLMIQVLPISIGGLGIREGALVLFLHPFLRNTDIPDSRVAAAGILWYGCLVVVSMLGAPSFAAGRRKSKAREKESAQ
jgi:uncharacterized protein (TIRG00374 family)